MQLASDSESTEIGIAVADLEARCLHVNRKAADLLGHSPEELRRSTFFDLMPLEDVPGAREAVRRLVAREAAEVVIERRCLRGDGTSLQVRATLALVEDAQGRPWRVLGVIEDLTAR
ncbi:MAG TPA: PAS domain S-box protein, partial [Usitatibacter sp.]|nr:PAS domain S-box protein [Usitatibacter sp.]